MKLTILFLLISLLGFGQANTTNFKGDIKCDGKLSASGLTHAEMVAEMINYTPSIAQNVYTRILPTYTTTENDGFTIAGDTITITKAGSYEMIFTITFQGGNNEDYNIAICKNGARVRTVRRTTLGSGNFVGGQVYKYLDGLVVGDDLSIKMTNITNSGDPTLIGAYIFIKKLY